jgi:hypothetical protein
MPWRVHIFILFLGILVVSPQEVVAAPSVESYSVIASRNVFGLKPDTAKEETQAHVPQTPGVDFRLTGLASMPSGKKQAALLILRPGQQTPEHRILAEGEQAGELRVVTVQMDTKKVMIRHRGENYWLAFGSHGIKENVAPAYESYETGPKRRQTL